MRKGWERKKFGDVCEYVKTPNTKKSLPYVGLEHIESRTGKFIGSLSPQRVKSTTFHFTKDLLLYGRLRPYLNKVLLPEFEGHCSTEIFPIRTKDCLDKRFLFYWMTNYETVKKIDATWTGARMPRANMNAVLNFEIVIPPLPEQRHIVSILDSAFAAIDKAKANAAKNLQNAKELFESYLQGVFERKGEDWEERTLSEIADNWDSKRVPITKSARKSGEYPYYGASGIVDYVADYIFDDDLLLVSEDGANLLARTYPIAFSASGKSWVNNHAHVLHFKSMDSQRFVEYYLNSIRLDNYVSGMAQPKLNQKMLNSIPIPFPPIERQKLINVKLDSLSDQSKKLESIYVQKLNDLEELKKSILQKAFNGELKTAVKELA